MIGEKDVHVKPINDLVDHDETRHCWCQPALLRPCYECDDDDDDCWVCGGEGQLPAEVEDGGTIIVVHNAADGRE